MYHSDRTRGPKACSRFVFNICINGIIDVHQHMFINVGNMNLCIRIRNIINNHININTRNNSGMIASININTCINININIHSNMNIAISICFNMHIGININMCIHVNIIIMNMNVSVGIHINILPRETPSWNGRRFSGVSLN